ncbi:hypothetical protein DF185_22750 [Marinifilum breve]|uniref:DUF4302 domain-containing protein n=1 Tax=Marinifilum breve TaxID=2184082 RepID=A0A2V3ZR05_9BACT|nr:DUF4302 domain-containing protein [Marinifilum breve]PXX95013.1 hypothetical protein DF185_22750 [Marinifilum breve]
MKRLLYVFTMLIAFSACEDDYEYAIDKTPTERKVEAKTELMNLLKGSEFGWKTVLVYQGPNDKASAGDFFVMKFEQNGENFNGEVTIANGFKEEKSEFVLNHEAGTILNFNTYNDVFHWLTKPNIWEGQGFGGDQEFIFMREDAGNLIFQGKELGNEMILEKATEQDWDMTDIQEMREKFLQLFEKNFVAFKITDGMGATEENPFFIRFNPDGVAINMSAVPDKEGWFYEMVWEVDGEKVYGQEASYVFTHDELIFSYPVVVKGDTLDRISYNEVDDTWVIGNKSVVGTLATSDLPMWQSPGMVDKAIDIFFQQYASGWKMYPWNYDEPDNIVTGYAKGIDEECEMFDYFAVHSNYTNSAGENLGAGFILEGADYSGKYAFLPIEIIKLDESELKFVWNGEVITDIEDAAAAKDVINTDPHIQNMLNAFCNPVGWSIYCSSYFYTPTWEIYPAEFYNMEDPSIVIKAWWSISY